MKILSSTWFPIKLAKNINKGLIKSINKYLIIKIIFTEDIKTLIIMKWQQQTIKFQTINSKQTILLTILWSALKQVFFIIIYLKKDKTTQTSLYKEWIKNEIGQKTMRKALSFWRITIWSLRSKEIKLRPMKWISNRFKMSSQLFLKVKY